MKSEDLKQSYIKFFSEDTTQAFVVLFLCLTVLRIANYVDMDSYTRLMTFGIIGFFGEKITNFKGLR